MIMTWFCFFVMYEYVLRKYLIHSSTSLMEHTMIDRPNGEHLLVRNVLFLPIKNNVWPNGWNGVNVNPSEFSPRLKFSHKINGSYNYYSHNMVPMTWKIIGSLWLFEREPFTVANAMRTSCVVKRFTSRCRCMDF